jgi:hypothetical protein
MRRVTVAGFLALVLGCPGLARAQAGYYLLPSLSVSENFDSNVFGTSTQTKSDFYTLIIPSLTAGYQSQPFTLLATYSFGAEIYAENSELSGVNRHHGGLFMRYLPTPQAVLGLTAAYDQSRSTTPFFQPPGATGTTAGPGGTTPTPGQAGTPSPTTPTPGQAGTPTAPQPGISGVEVGRQRTTQVSASPSFSYAFTPRTSLESSYSYLRTEVSGGSTDSAHVGTFRLAHQLTPLDRVSLGYLPRYFESDTAPSVTSHAVTLGYGRKLTDQTDVTLEAGPRFPGGSVGVEANAALEQRFRLGSARLAYARSQGIAAGLSGAQDTDNVSATLTFQPLRELQVGLNGSFLRATPTEGGGSATTVYAVGTSASYQLTAWMWARAGYTFSLQEQGSQEIRRHTVTVGLDFSYPIRLY